jgi:hypothetical protein
MTDAELYNKHQGPIIRGYLNRIFDLVSLQYRLQRQLGFNIRYDLTDVPWSYVEYLLSDLE